MDTQDTEPVRFLDRSGGRVSYTLHGTGPLVVLVPGMGDLRAVNRELVGPLVDAGHRVAATDLRGMGDGGTGFAEFGDAATAGDMTALIRELGGPAVLVGNSMGAAASAIVAADTPELVAGLVGVGPILRNPPTSGLMRAVTPLLFRGALARPWGARFWGGFYRSLNRGATAPWLDEHVAAIVANLREPGRLRDFRRLALTLDHDVATRRLPEIQAPMLHLVGTLDPDYRDPAAEAAWLRSLGAEVHELDETGHYPQAQRPERVVPITLGFLKRLRAGDDWRMPRA
ncbi:alpha/beta fold hydrolase [Agromyces aerolatus]|uniref:alpha/beta fold hydrolase n=1 Tax=Agromyces sp. LY-1074 TaxID=3074080 RepID=UPI00286554BD|nr:MULTISPECIES: alpha/beta hydrolase [unclassified Agromyces]MDR5701256.1 alpha/beta hydrolase [Agromyces sp. LY-1074]MDR5706868.1 alpha/beta hydrolase [Agromyces sp. LY-1358]